MWLSGRYETDIGRRALDDVWLLVCVFQGMKGKPLMIKKARHQLLVIMQLRFGGAPSVRWGHPVCFWLYVDVFLAAHLYCPTPIVESSSTFTIFFPLPPPSVSWLPPAGADIRSVCTEAGMYAIRARRKTVTEKDFLEAVNKVIKGYQKFSATPKYMVYN